MKFRDDAVVPVRRHLMCANCTGEMHSLGEGMSNTFGTSWKHRCDSCGVEAWSDKSYPRVEFLP